MIHYSSIESSLYFVNDGEIDLLTGSIAPNRFNQIVKRDIELANRSGDLLAIISLKINLPELVESRFKNQSIENIKLELEALLIEVHFKLKSILRSSDCVSRVSAFGFWIFINSTNPENLSLLRERINNLLIDQIKLEVIPREKNQDQVAWYELIDQYHFTN